MSELRFTVEHEWLRLDEDGQVTVGVTDYAQESLGDLVFVQLPEPGRYSQGTEVAVLESVKAASSIGMPLDGEVTEVNADLESSPELVNQEAQGKGWFFRLHLADNTALDTLMTEEGYARFLAAKA